MGVHSGLGRNFESPAGPILSGAQCLGAWTREAEGSGPLNVNIRPNSILAGDGWCHGAGAMGGTEEQFARSVLASSQ
jgi:hypothetical protein